MGWVKLKFPAVLNVLVATGIHWLNGAVGFVLVFK